MMDFPTNLKLGLGFSHSVVGLRRPIVGLWIDHFCICKRMDKFCTQGVVGCIIVGLACGC